MERTKVRDVMTSPAIVVAPQTPVPQASALMKERRIRHLPVIENGQLVGMVSRGDLREASISEAINADLYEISFLLSRLPVSKLMTRQVVTISPDALIVDAVALMTDNKIAGLPVVDGTRSVIGIVTESDLLRLLLRKLREAEER